MAIAPVLKRKYRPVKTNSATKNRSSDIDGPTGPPASATNACAAVHIASAGAVALKSSCRRLNLRLASWSEMTRLSSATATAPAVGPKKTAAVNVNASEMEKATGTFGSRSVAKPDNIVNAARTSHGNAALDSARWWTDVPTASTPPVITSAR